MNRIPVLSRRRTSIIVLALALLAAGTAGNWVSPAAVHSAGGDLPAATPSQPSGLIDLGTFSTQYYMSGMLTDGFGPRVVNDQGVIGGIHVFVGTDNYQEYWPALWANGTVTAQPFDDPGDVNNTAYCNSPVSFIDDSNREFGQLCRRAVTGGARPAWWGTDGQWTLWPGDWNQLSAGFTSVSANGVAGGFNDSSCGAGDSFIGAPPSYSSTVIARSGCLEAVNDSGAYILSSGARAGTGTLVDGNKTVSLPVADYWFGLDSAGDSLGMPSDGKGKLVVRKANGSIVQVPMAPNAYTEFFSNSGGVVGEVGTTWMYWPGSGPAMPLSALLPKNSGWTVTSVFSLSDNYVLGEGTYKGADHEFLLKLGATVKLSGALWITDCTNQSCRRGGSAGDSLDISGADLNGTKVTASATSDTGGKWSANVPPGTYTIKPPMGFVPDSKTLTVKTDMSGIDFATCGTVAAPGSRVPAHAARHGEATGETGCPDAIDWQMPKRVEKGQGLVGDGLPLPRYVYPSSWSAKLYLSVDGTRVTVCPAKYVWKWQVTAATTKGKGKPVINQPANGCETSFKTTQLGTYRVSAQRYEKTSKGLVKTKLSVPKPQGKGQPPPNVTLNDVLIVGLGDSNGSGEGDPPFYFDQCDRGINSYQYQAAQNLEDQFAGHTSVTFVADACSGATIQNLITAPYVGIQPGTPLVPQILALKDLISHTEGQPRRHVDAAFVSVGINNIGFGPLLKYCVTHGGHCETQKVEPTYSKDGAVDGFKIGVTNPNALTLRQWIATLTAHLPGEYQTIRAGMASLVSPKDTFITDYPTFVYRDTEGDVCGRTTFSWSGATPFPASTWDWLKSAGSALNAQVDATSRLGWHVVRVNPGYFLGHGYCAKDSWFVSLTKAEVNNEAGAFHATDAGAAVTAKLAEYNSCPVLAEAKECEGIRLPTIP